MRWLVLSVLQLAVISGVNGGAFAQDVIILRNLELLNDIRVQSMDINGVHLKDGRSVIWSRILQGKLATQQTHFDLMVREIGQPMFQIQSRLAKGAIDKVGDQARLLLEKTNDGDGITRYVAMAARFQDLLWQSQREQAIMPLLDLLRMRAANPSFQALDQTLILEFDQHGICQQLLPVWFDSDKLQVLRARLTPLANDPFSNVDVPAIKIYQAALANHLQVETPVVDKTEQQLVTAADSGEWPLLLSAQSLWINGKPSDVLKLLDDSNRFNSTTQQAVALYYRGLAERALCLDDVQPKTPLATNDRATTVDAWQLSLLQIPASFGERFPELAAAAIFHVVTDSRDLPNEYGSLEKELVTRFSLTHFGRQFQSIRK